MTQVGLLTRPAGGWQPRTAADLICAQLRGIAVFHGTQQVQPGTQGSHSTREQRLDEARRQDIADRERRALLAMAEAAQHEVYPLDLHAAPRAVLAHRNAWLREKLTLALRELGVSVAASTDDGAEASAAIAFEQPEIVFVEDLLPGLRGIEVIARAVTCAPEALIAAAGMDQDSMRGLSGAGARAVFSRRIPPTEVADELVWCLHHQDVVLSRI